MPARTAALGRQIGEPVSLFFLEPLGFKKRAAGVEDTPSSNKKT
jgi:hypothetical protein